MYMYMWRLELHLTALTTCEPPLPTFPVQLSLQKITLGFLNWARFDRKGLYFSVR